MWGPVAPKEQTASGKGSTSLQSHLSTGKALLASAGCRAAGMAVAGPTGPSYLQALQRKTNDSLMDVLNCVASPGVSEVTADKKGCVAPQPSCFCGRALWSSFSRHITSFPRKEKEINIQIHLLSKRSLAAKEKVTLTL